MRKREESKLWKAQTKHFSNYMHNKNESKEKRPTFSFLPAWNENFIKMQSGSLFIMTWKTFEFFSKKIINQSFVLLTVVE